MNKLVIATHNGTFHLDELLAIAVIILVHHDYEIEVIRTRDQEVIDSADWVVDVSKVYDHQSRRYDHHQRGAPIRDNDVPYAALGLVWKHWGSKLCSDQAVVDRIDTEIIQMLDGPDNGFDTTTSLVSGGKVPSLHLLSVLWQPNWNDRTISEDDRFFELLPIAIAIMEKIIAKYESWFVSAKAFEDQYQLSKDKRIIEVEKGVWPDDVSKYPEVIFVVYEDKENKTWKAKCVNHVSSFTCRVPFPESWRGLDKAMLQELLAFNDVEFVHPSGFLAVAKSRDTIMKMCHLALAN